MSVNDLVLFFVISGRNFDFINYLLNRHTKIRFHVLGSLRNFESKTDFLPAAGVW